MLAQLTRHLKTAAATIIQRAYTQSDIHLRHRACKCIQKLVRARVSIVICQKKKITEFRQRRSATRIQRTFRACNRELFGLRKQIKWVTARCVPGGSLDCPITRMPIVHPVINICDGRLYEEEALAQWQQRSDFCPTTRRKSLELIPVNQISECLYLQKLENGHLVKQLENCFLMLHSFETILLPNFSAGSNGEWSCMHCSYHTGEPNKARLCIQHYRNSH